MKLKKHNYLLLIITLLAFTACNQKSGISSSSISSEDSMKIAFYDKFFKVEDSLNNYSKNQPVKIKAADSCINRFDTIVNINRDIKKMIKMCETKEVRFQFKELTTWMKNNLDTLNSDEIRICFGVYDKKYLIARHSQNVNKYDKRLTVFLWPYKNGVRSTRNKQGGEIEPFNLGDLHP